MPAPIAPVAGIALKYAAIAAAGFLVARALPAGKPDPRAEAAMDDMPDGLSLSADDDAARAAMRWRRTLRLGAVGAQIDAAFLGRLRMRRT
ncbi:MAG: hypothetical protein AAF914_09990 [Pseudomonadota bacterium]